MAANRGKDLLIKYNSGTFGSPSWATLGGLRARQIRKGRTMIDVTTADSASLARVLLTGGGVFSMTITGDGVFEDTAAQNTMNDRNDDGTLMDLQLTIGELGVYRGYFQVSDMTFGGDHDKELTFSVTLESSGVQTFTTTA
jgi:TP901-1 family phage major tail protein